MLIVQPSIALTDESDAYGAVGPSSFSGGPTNFSVRASYVALGLMGMLPTAMDGWAVLHRSLATAMAFYFVPQLCTLTVLLILLTGVDIWRLHLTIPLFIACVSTV